MRVHRRWYFGGRPSKPESGNGLVSAGLVAEHALDDFGVLGALVGLPVVSSEKTTLPSVSLHCSGWCRLVAVIGVEW